MQTSASPLSQLRILVVEDSAMVAQFIAATLEDAEAIVVGPCSSVAEAHDTIDQHSIDAAVLDVNVADGEVFPIAERLQAMGIAFLLLSGYGAGAVPKDRPSWRALGKPFRMASLVDAVAERVSANQRPGLCPGPAGA